MRWAFVGVLAIGAYSLFNATTWSMARERRAVADTLQTELDKAQRRPNADRMLSEVVLAHGAIRLPRGVDQGLIELADAVNSVLQAHKEVINSGYKDRDDARMQGTTLAGVIEPGKSAAKVSGEVEFEAPPEVTAAVVAELETHPNIDAVSRLDITKPETGRNVKVRLTVDGWVAVTPNRRR